MKKDKAFIFIANRNYLFAIGTMIINLKETGNDFYDNIVIYHHGFTDEDKEKLLSLEDRIIFKEYSLEEYEDHHGKATHGHEKAFMNRYTHLTIIKYRVIEQLEYFHKILYLDLDMLVRGSISEIFDIKGAAWRDAAADFQNKFAGLIPLEQLIEYCGSDAEHIKKWKAPNGGLLYFSDDGIDYEKCLEEARAFVSHFKGYFSRGIDEKAISYIVNKNNIQLTSLDKGVYNTFPVISTCKTKIIHFMTPEKVWNDPVLQAAFHDWLTYFKKSQSVVSFEASPVTDFDMSGMREALYERAWTDILQKNVIPEVLQPDMNLSTSQLLLKYSPDINYVLRLALTSKKIAITLAIRDKEFDRSLLKNGNTFLTASETDDEIIVKYKAAVTSGTLSDAFYKFYDETIKIIEKVYCLNEKSSGVAGAKGPAPEEAFAGLKTVEDYFSYIRIHDELLCVISGKDECSRYFSRFAEATGLETKSKPGFREGYILITDGKGIIYECTVPKGKMLRYDTVIKEGDNTVFVSVTSEGYRLGMEKSEIIINNYDYSVGMRGLNIVTLNKNTGEIADRINVDTWKKPDFEINRI